MLSTLVTFDSTIPATATQLLPEFDGSLRRCCMLLTSIKRWWLLENNWGKQQYKEFRKQHKFCYQLICLRWPTNNWHYHIKITLTNYIQLLESTRTQPDNAVTESECSLNFVKQTKFDFGRLFVSLYHCWQADVRSFARKYMLYAGVYLCRCLAILTISTVAA